MCVQVMKEMAGQLWITQTVCGSVSFKIYLSFHFCPCNLKILVDLRNIIFTVKTAMIATPFIWNRCMMSKLDNSNTSFDICNGVFLSHKK